MKRPKHNENQKESCSPTCYMIKKTHYKPSSSTYNLITRIAETFGTDPCFIHLFISYLKMDITCSQISSLLLKTNTGISFKQTPSPYLRKNFNNLDFQPCSHAGPCVNNRECVCFRNKTYCEHSCQCECCNLVTYCTCKTCDASCPCALKSRECTCHENCDNRALFNHSGKKTFIGASSTAGFGLYAAEPITSGSFIIEYIGELISLLESERRGVFYDQKKISYLFGLRTENEEIDTIDATRIGNNARFINHCKNANIIAKQIITGGMSRIGFYAKRDIRENEELFFDYKYNEETKKQFHITD